MQAFVISVKVIPFKNPQPIEVIMIKKLIYSSLLMFAFTQTLSAEDAEEDFLRNTHRAEILQIEEIEAIKLPAAEVTEAVDDILIHTITGIQNDGNTVELEDGSLWSIGWWTKSKSAKWTPGEKVRVFLHVNTYYNNYIELNNITRKDSAWGLLYTASSGDSPNLKYIVSFDNHNTVVVLNDGTRLKSSNLNAFNKEAFRAGDIVFLYTEVPGSTPYGLWNFNTWWRVYGLTIDTK